MLVFSFAYNLSCSDQSVRVGAIAQTLADGDVLSQMVPLSLRDDKSETAVSLLERLFRKWTFENSSRASQLRVFREAVHRVGNGDVLDECLPNLSEIESKVVRWSLYFSLAFLIGCSDDELRTTFLRVKKAVESNVSTTEISPRILKWLIPEGECN